MQKLNSNITNNMKTSWENMSNRWEELFAPPGRPSTNDIKIFKKLLYSSLKDNKNNNIEVLVLGATPEIRDMLAEDPDIRVTLVDKTMDMILAMSSLLKSDHSNEVWIRSSWQRAPLRTEYFDAIFSDLVICNVFPNEHDLFLKKVKNLLRKRGHWFNRIYCIDDNTKIRTLDELFEEYKDNTTISKEDVNNFRSAAGLKYWNSKSKILVWEKLLNEMEQYQNEGKFMHSNENINEILSRAYDLVLNFNQKYWIDTKEGTDTLLSKYFKISNTIRDFSVSSLQEKGYYIYDLEKI